MVLYPPLEPIQLNNCSYISDMMVMHVEGMNKYTHIHTHHTCMIKFGSSVIHTVLELLNIDDSIQNSINLEILEFFLSFLVCCFLSVYVGQGFLSFIIEREAPGSKLSVFALLLLSHPNVFILSLKV